jgi:cysteinyl-tRNA synthetase
LGLIAQSETEWSLQEIELAPNDLSQDLQALFFEREKARQAKNYVKADQLRAQFLKAGYQLIDQGEQVLIKKLSQPVNK